MKRFNYIHIIQILYLGVVEITLVESDKYTADDGLETKTYDLSGLEHNKSYQQTFVFDRKFKVFRLCIFLKNNNIKGVQVEAGR